MVLEIVLIWYVDCVPSKVLYAKDLLAKLWFTKVLFICAYPNVLIQHIVIIEIIEKNILYIVKYVLWRYFYLKDLQRESITAYNNNIKHYFCKFKRHSK